MLTCTSLSFSLQLFNVRRTSAAMFTAMLFSRPGTSTNEANTESDSKAEAEEVADGDVCSNPIPRENVSL